MRLPMARRANFLAVNLNPSIPAANRRPEINRRLIFKICARLRSACLMLLLLA
jgi:hypothetical protein